MSNKVGVVEGFYGKPWPEQHRLQMLEFLGASGIDHYIYAPKADESLRKGWAKPFSIEELAFLANLAKTAKTHLVRWGVGLSLLDIQGGLTASKRAALGAKLEQLNAVGIDLLWLLFDDMRGDHPNLAKSQLEAAAFVAQHTSAALALCPTYYSDDPILPQVFGAMPDRYWDELGGQLSMDIDLLWTGPEVVSSEITVDHCQRVAERLGRSPLLWDNYPVNDGAAICDFLHLEPLAGRDGLADVVAGHFCNPMNQAHLSKPALWSLAQLYTQPDIIGTGPGFPDALAALLARDGQLFQHQGLQQLDIGARRALLSDYGAVNHPAATEVCDWLNNQYAFDPDCLT